ncbi:hypothetical protein IB024_01280 [Brucella sp. 6810]|uniref:hypothetical protein n=1 Tax=Brucella sp. 6810 TaxID=2769351 RepID=UPI00165CBAF2|nr:hypothetical protein [Brucella sp. 6810]QNQ62421.1 hypothetical protein IB024_01280 [Brucella sp. 6810]
MLEEGSFIYTVFAAGVGALVANFIPELIKSFSRKGQVTEANHDDDLKEILKSVSEIQELSEKFWLASDEELGKDCAVLRARILSRQQYVLGLVASLLKGEDKRSCDYQFTSVMNAASGGDFMEPDRPPEPGRLIAIHKECLQFCHAIKAARRNLPRSILA